MRVTPGARCRRYRSCVHVGELLRDVGLADEVRHEEVLEDLVAARALLLAVAEHSPGVWARVGACRGHAEVMFPTRGEPTEPAKALCASCPVLEPCAEWAGTVPASQSGIIAGTSERARRDARRAGASFDAAA